MFIALDDPGDSPTAKPGPLARWAGLGALLLAEGLALSVLFDSTPFLGDRRWWAILLVFGPRLLGRLVIAGAVAMPLIGGARLREALWRASGQGGQHRTWPLLLGHLAAFAGFAGLTGIISGGDLGTAYPGGWVIAWAALGAVTLGTWAAAALPVGVAWAVARTSAARLLTGVAVAAAAVGAGQVGEQVFWSSHDGSPLVRATFRVAAGLIGLICSDPVCRPAEAVVGTRGFCVAISPQCSGYEGMGLVLVFLGAYLAFCRRDYRYPRALLLLPLGVAAMWLANIARIVLLVAVGLWVSPTVAVHGFHDQAGWLAFNGIALGLVAGSRRLRFFTRSDPGDDGAEYTNPTAAYLVPLLVILATTMITAAFSSGFDRFYPLRVLAAAAALWYFRRDYVALRWTWSWPAVAIGVGAFMFWMALEPTPTGTAAETALASGLASLPGGWAATWLAFRASGSVVIVPLAEELAFRGYLTRRLIATEFQDVPVGRFTWPSFLISSALFGALHGRWIAGILAGMLYAIALYRRGELADAIVAHATTNTLIAVYVLLAGAWSLWA